jgi:hypothetical protein
MAEETVVLMVENLVEMKALGMAEGWEFESESCWGYLKVEYSVANLADYSVEWLVESKVLLSGDYWVDMMVDYLVPLKVERWVELKDEKMVLMKVEMMVS